MSLHGDIRVNGQRIGFWSARRLQPEIGRVNLYRYEVECANKRAAGFLWHNYSDGAAPLAAAVLDRWRFPGTARPCQHNENGADCALMCYMQMRVGDFSPEWQVHG